MINLNAQLNLLKSSNPAAYWNIINKRKTKSRVGNLSHKTLYDHFKIMNQVKLNSVTPVSLQFT